MSLNLAKIVFKGKKRELRAFEAAHKRKKDNSNRTAKDSKNKPAVATTQSASNRANDSNLLPSSHNRNENKSDEPFEHIYMLIDEMTLFHQSGDSVKKTRMVIPSEESIQTIKRHVKQGGESIAILVADTLLDKLDQNHSQVRLLALEVIHVLFMRSHVSCDMTVVYTILSLSFLLSTGALVPL